MNDVVLRIKEAVKKSGLRFSSRPILIGGQVFIPLITTQVSGYNHLRTNHNFAKL
ncbi:MAG: hypothetical protein K2F89_04610 [Treponemataceae bacterium]|nr:hypothetical protein [Treponemataceae bacterium]